MDYTYEDVIVDAIKWHSGQVRRSSNLPYIHHVMEVAKVVQSYEKRMSIDFSTNPKEVITAAYLHDILEDTECPEEEVEKYGSNVLKFVKELTIPSDYGGTKVDKFMHLEHFANYSLEAVVIKIADRYSNLMDFLREGKRFHASRYAIQGYPVYRAYLERGKNEKVIDVLRKIQEVVSYSYSSSIFTLDRQDFSDFVYEEMKVIES